MQEETQTLLKKLFVRDSMVHAGKALKIVHISQYYSIFSQIFSLEIDKKYKDYLFLFFLFLLFEPNNFRGGCRTAATSKMERFVIIVNGFQPLTLIKKRSILGVAAVLDRPLNLGQAPDMNCMNFLIYHIR